MIPDNGEPRGLEAAAEPSIRGVRDRAFLPPASQEPEEEVMTPFQWQIPRDLAREFGREAVSIVESGRYRAPSGRIIEIATLVDAARAGTTSYPPYVLMPEVPEGTEDTVIEVENTTTLAAAQRLLEDGFDTVVLNFASATEPGGGFLRGARAQEEYLARSSGLYACLRENPMYAFHQEPYDPMYTDYVIYSPAVPVFRGDSGELLEEPYSVGIITCPAPDANDMSPDQLGEIEDVMRGRIRKVLLTGLYHGHDAIVLGAWGCGAFGNDPRLFARLFKESIDNDVSGAYRKIVFAIVDSWEDRRTIGPFREVFGF